MYFPAMPSRIRSIGRKEETFGNTAAMGTSRRDPERPDPNSPQSKAIKRRGGIKTFHAELMDLKMAAGNLDRDNITTKLC